MTDIRTHALANALLALLQANTTAVNQGALRMVDDKHREPMRAAETHARKVLLDHGFRIDIPVSLETVTSDARRRDAFATSAPEVPDWFRATGLPTPVPTLATLLKHDPRWNDLREAERAYLMLWAEDPDECKLQVHASENPDLAIGTLAVMVGQRTEKLHKVKWDDYEHAVQRFKLSRLAAWRWVFADAMLAEDAKNTSKPEHSEHWLRVGPGKQPPTARMQRAYSDRDGLLSGATILAALFGPKW